MSLRNRLLYFFLGALGAVLVGFSLALYALASWHLHSNLDEKLDAAKLILIASIEVHPDDVEWEPQERAVTLGRDVDDEHVRWVIRDQSGELIDCSANLDQQSAESFPRQGGPWRLMRWKMVSGKFEPQVVDEPHGAPPRSSLSATLPFDRKARRSAFEIAVAIAEGPVQAALWQLALTMGAISLAIGSIAVLTGRWLCDQALEPVTRMAAQTRVLHSDPEKRELLEVPSTEDEISDLGRAFNELLVLLRESIEQQRRFAGEASHQLRTPLAAILTAVDVASRRSRDPDEYERVLDVVRRRGHELQRIIELLLTLTRGELPASHSEFELIDLHQWCQEQLATWRDNPRWRDIQFTPNAEVIQVRTHRLILAQAFDNVLDNAIKYSQPNSPITLSISRDGASAILQIADRGSGISAADLAQVFHPFFRSSEARSSGVPGVGLGLAIAQRLTGLLGGKLRANSKLEVGTTFQFELPLAS